MSIYKIIVQVIATGSQVVIRAFTRALRQELAASRVHTAHTQTQDDAPPKPLSSMSLQEAMKILNVDELDREKIEQNYKRMFEADGNSFYIKSKIFRAKERLDEETSGGN